MRVTVLFSTCARGGGLYSSAHALGKGNCIGKFCPAFGQLFSGVTVQYSTCAKETVLFGAGVEAIVLFTTGAGRVEGVQHLC
jgi:hypothetical protein